MVGVREWFAKEIHRLGFSELGSVYDYAESLNDDETRQFFVSLMGSESRIQAFADSYIQARRKGAQQSGSSSGTQSSSDGTALTFWEDVQATVEATPTKKSKASKRGKSKPAQPAKLSKGKQSGKVSFVSKVKNEKPQPNSQLAQAIKGAPVEQVREKIREYRKNKQVVNCIRCGHIERVIREDGACSFCKATIFSIWERGQGASGSEYTPREPKDSSVERAARARLGGSLQVVLGRHVRPVGQRKDGSSLILGAREPGDSANAEKAKHTASARGSHISSRYYRNPQIDIAQIEAACRSEETALRELVAHHKRQKEGSSSARQGILIVDNVVPNAQFYG